MPFKSRAQAKKFGVLLEEGKITKAQFDEWHASTPDLKSLPYRIKKKKKATNKKKGGFVSGLKKTAGQSLAGTTDAAILKHNKKLMERMVTRKRLFSMKDISTLYPGLKLLKTADPSLAMEANDQSGWSIGDAMPGTELRNNAETGQFQGKSYRTSGVQNENKEMKQSLKTKAQTARGGKHYGGTIREGV